MSKKQKIIIFTLVGFGVVLYSFCYFFIFKIIMHDQIYDDKFCKIVKSHFSNSIESIYILNGSYINIHLFIDHRKDLEKKEVFQRVFEYIIENHKDIDRIDEINFGFKPKNARVFNPEYQYYRYRDISKIIKTAFKRFFGTPWRGTLFKPLRKTRSRVAMKSCAISSWYTTSSAASFLLDRMKMRSTGECALLERRHMPNG